MARPSDLRRRIVLQSRVTAQDSFGQQSVHWTDYLAGIAAGAAKVVSDATPGATTLLACTAHGFAEGALVTVAGITGITGLPRTFGVLAPSTNAFSIALDTTGATLVASGATATPVSGVPAQIEPLSGRELEAAAAANSELTHRIVIRQHLTMLEPTLVGRLRAVFVHGAVTRYFNLSPGVNLDERNRYLTITASEGLNLG